MFVLPQSSPSCLQEYLTGLQRMKQCQVIKIATIQMTDALNNLPRMGLSARPQLCAQSTSSTLLILMLHS